MKKSKIIAAAMASIALAGALAGCGKDEEKVEYNAENNANVCVYGPPSAFYDDYEDGTGEDDAQQNEGSASEQMAESQGD